MRWRRHIILLVALVVAATLALIYLGENKDDIPSEAPGQQAQ
jgi:hypothetical protein